MERPADRHAPGKNPREAHTRTLEHKRRGPFSGPLASAGLFGPRSAPLDSAPHAGAESLKQARTSQALRRLNDRRRTERAKKDARALSARRPEDSFYIPTGLSAEHGLPCPQTEE